MGLGWSSAEERQPLLRPPPPPPAAQRRPQPRGPVGGPAVPVPVPVRRLAPAAGRVYGRRWLVLLLFSLLGFSQGLVWNSWGPIQNSARLAFGFSGWDIALLVFWGPIGFVPCFFFMWLMDKKVALMLIGYLDIFFSLYACIKNIKKQKEKEENYSGMPLMHFRKKGDPVEDWISSAGSCDKFLMQSEKVY